MPKAFLDKGHKNEFVALSLCPISSTKDREFWKKKGGVGN